MRSAPELHRTIGPPIPPERRSGLNQPEHPTGNFAGWRIVAVCAIALAFTAPGQTIGFSVFIDHLIDGLQITRSQISAAYLVGTLTGAFGLRFIGRLLDRRGSRFTMTATVSAFVLVLIGMANVIGLVTLTIGFIGMRMLGQGGISMVATTTPAAWFKRRRGFAIGMTTAIGQALISAFPVAAAGLILVTGWRQTYLIMAGTTLLIVLPIARWGIIDRPQDIGQNVDGDADQPSQADVHRDLAARSVSFTPSEAIRTRAFWTLAGGLMTASMVSTGLSFHQIDLLSEQGLSAIEGAANFLPQMVAALLFTLGAGAFIDRFADRFVLMASMTVLISAMIGVGFVSPGITAILYGVAMGMAQGFNRTIEGGSFPKLFGLGHVGEIRGIVRALMTASSAFGPLAFSIGFDITGNYRQTLLALLLLPTSILLFATTLTPPTRKATTP